MNELHPSQPPESTPRRPPRRRSPPAGRAAIFLPLVVFLALGAAVLLFTYYQHRTRLELLRRQADGVVAALTERLQQMVAARVGVMSHLSRLEAAGESAAGASTAALAETLSLVALVHLRPDGQAHGPLPTGPPSEPELLRDKIAASYFRRAVEEKTDLITPPQRLASGEWGFAGYFPIVRQGRVEEVLAGFFSFAALLDRAVGATRSTDYNLLLRAADENRVVYERWRGRHDERHDLLRRGELRIAGHRYEIEALPGPPLVAEAERGLWPVRIFGLLLAALAALAWRLLLLKDLALARRERTLGSLLEGLPLTLFRVDPRGVLVEASGSGAEALGLPRQLGEQDFGRQPPALAAALAAAAEGRTGGCELRAGEASFEVTLKPDRLEPGGVVGFAYEVSGRRQLEEALELSESHYRGFFQGAPFGYLLTDAEGRIELANREAARLFHRSEAQLLGRRLLDVFGAGKRDRLAAAQIFERVENGEELRDRELRLTRPDGKSAWFSLSVQPAYQEGEYAGGRFVLFDISRRKELEERLRQTGKMEALGRFAGGITHDFNNLLTAIMGFARIARGRLAAGSPLERDLGEIEKAGKRATALVARLLAFARQQPSEAKVVELNASVRDLASMLRRLVREDVELELRLGDAGSIRIDPAQLEQMLVNLVVNGVEAIEGRGHLVIETSTRHPTGGEPQSRIRVIDDGRGMAPEVKEHLFEPFFTTKSAEEGSGLGLATVYGIVEQHRGEISIDSEQGLGTTVTVLLPRIPSEEKARVPPTTVNLPPSGQERVLVVEDEEQVREMAKEMLEILGYQVTAARDGRHALELIAGRESEIDLLLSDVVMPNLGGEALYHALKARHPGLRVLFTSGYTDDVFIRKSVEEGSLDFLQKPYTLDSLAVAMRAALRHHPA
jgi:PAS domain S-box-containing protein